MTLTVRALRGMCAVLAEDLINTGQASASTLEPVAPGGEENPSRGAAAWLRYYGHLQFTRGKVSGPSGTGDGGRGAAADGIAIAALGALPKSVELASGETVEVHPKSLEALLRADAHNRILGRLAGWLAQFNRDDAPDPELIIDVQAEATYQLQLLAWIATTAGPGLPFSAALRQPEIPSDVAAWNPPSVLAIQRAFAQVNWVALRALEHLIAPDPESGQPPKRPSWSMFLGALAVETHEDPAMLVRNRALVSIVAATQLAGGARRDAMANAERKRKTKER